MNAVCFRIKRNFSIIVWTATNAVDKHPKQHTVLTRQFGPVGAHLLFRFAVERMRPSFLGKNDHACECLLALAWLRFPLNVKTLPLLLEPLLVTTPLYVLSVSAFSLSTSLPLHLQFQPSV